MSILSNVSSYTSSYSDGISSNQKLFLIGKVTSSSSADDVSLSRKPYGIFICDISEIFEACFFLAQLLDEMIFLSVAYFSK